MTDQASEVTAKLITMGVVSFEDSVAVSQVIRDTYAPLVAERDRLQEQLTLRQIADAGIGTTPIGIKRLEQLRHAEAERDRLREACALALPLIEGESMGLSEGNEWSVAARALRDALDAAGGD